MQLSWIQISTESISNAVWKSCWRMRPVSALSSIIYSFSLSLPCEIVTSIFDGLPMFFGVFFPWEHVSSQLPCHVSDRVSVSAIKALFSRCDSVVVRNAWNPFKVHEKQRLDRWQQLSVELNCLCVFILIACREAHTAIVYINGAALANVDIWQVNTELNSPPVWAWVFNYRSHDTALPVL